MTSPLDHASQIAAWMAETDLAMLELTGPSGGLRLVRTPSGGVVACEGPAASARDEGGHVVTAPSFGQFLDRHPLADGPLAVDGEPVRAGDVIGFLRVGPLLTPVVAPEPGVITGSLAEPGTLVGYGTALFAFIPDGTEPP